MVAQMTVQQEDEGENVVGDLNFVFAAVAVVVAVAVVAV
jgi:hypothetical protein